MNKIVLTSVSVRKVVALVLTLALVFGWSAIAFAQTSSEAQYGSPTETAAGNPAVAGGTEAKIGSAEAKAGEAEAKVAEAKAKAEGAKAKVLPATGGPLLPLVALGALALGATGMLVLRQVGRR